MSNSKHLLEEGFKDALQRAADKDLQDIPLYENPNEATAGGPQNHVDLVQEAMEAKEIAQAFSKLSPADRELAERQVFCPVAGARLGSMGMGAPIRVDVQGNDVMICCEGCRKSLLAEPEKHLAAVKRYHEESAQKFAPPTMEPRQ